MLPREHHIHTSCTRFPQIAKLEQHCRSTFLLTRMFKMFDKDNSSTIDKQEMVAVLLTFSIELTETQLDAIMQVFGAQEVGGEPVHSLPSSKFSILLFLHSNPPLLHSVPHYWTNRLESSACALVSSLPKPTNKHLDSSFHMHRSSPTRSLYLQSRTSPSSTPSPPG